MGHSRLYGLAKLMFRWPNTKLFKIHEKI